MNRYSSYVRYVAMFALCLSIIWGAHRADGADFSDLVSALNQGNTEQALSYLNDIGDRLDAQQQNQLDQFLTQKDLTFEWIPFLQTLSHLYPAKPTYQLHLAKAHLNGGQTEAGIQTLTSLLEEHPDNLLMLHQAALLAYSRHEYAHAQRWIERLLKHQPTHIDALFLKGCIQARQGDTDQAATTLKSVLELAPNHRLVHYELGLLEKQRGNDQQAVTYLSETIHRQPFFLEAYNALLVVLARQKQTHDIERLQPIAVYLKSWPRPKMMQVWNAFRNQTNLPPQETYALAGEFCRVKRDDLTTPLLIKLVQRGITDAPVLTLLAQAQYNTDEYPQCLETLNRLAPSHQQAETVVALKGWTLFQMGLYAEAGDIYDAAIQHYPSSKSLNNLNQALKNPAEYLASSSQKKRSKGATEKSNPKSEDKFDGGTKKQTVRTTTSTSSQSTAFHFADVTQKVGLQSFQHILGHRDKRWITDAMGSGVSVGDYDNDGDDDIYLVNGRPSLTKADAQWTNALYRNEGGTFINVTHETGVGDTGFGMCALFGDIDNDGWLDLFVGNVGANVIYHNNGDGTFSDRTQRAGLGCDRYCAAATFADVNQDGHLDLFVGNYVEFDPQKQSDVRSHYMGMSVFAGPLVFPAQADRLYLNQGDGTFRDVSKQSGINQSLGRAMGAVFFDLEQDGDLDLYITNDSTYNFVLQNNGDGTFEDVSLFSGGAFTETGVEGASMGVETGDLNNDQRFDLFVTSYEKQTDRLFINQGEGLLSDQTGPFGLLSYSYMKVTWGTLFCDFDADGFLDIFTADGHLYPQVNQLQKRERYIQGVSFYRNLNGSRFEDITTITTLDNFAPRSSRGAGLLDFDNDGDMDIVINCMDAPPQLLENRTPQQNWLKVQLNGTSAETIGVRVVARKRERTWSRQISAGSGYLSQSTTTMHFGFGEVDAIDTLSIYWQRGEAQILTSPILNQTLVVDAPSKKNPKKHTPR